MKTKRNVILIFFAIIFFFFLIFALVSHWNQRRVRMAEVPKPAAPIKKSGVVASAHPLASKIGIEILKKGGNAIDAAVAAAFALGVVEPFASGIGGGGFMVIYLGKSKEVITIDYREMAPLKATLEMYQGPDGQLVENRINEGHTSAAVPGAVAGLTLALTRYGTMDLKSILGPSVEIAENGYTVSNLLESMMETNAQKLLKFPAAARVYLKDGRPYKAGDRLYLKDLAKTYRLIAENGPTLFYNGAIAAAIEEEMKSGNGWMTKEDLQSYRPLSRAPVQGSYHGYDIFTMGPPSSGGAHIIELLNIFEGYDMARLGPNTSEAIRLMAEAMKRVFSEREKFMGDPDFVEIPLKDLLSKEHAGKLRGEIKIGETHGKRVDGGPLFHSSDQTTHLSVADGEGNLVALTQTINSFFGSGVVVPGTGILLNNEMNDFTPQKGSPNSIQPRKRPGSSISPTLVLKDGKPYLTIGMPGATRIITVLPQILMNIIDYKMTIQEAINAPRIHCVDGKEISMESRIAKRVQDELIRLGYKLEVRRDFDLYFGGAQGVMMDPETGRLHGAADPRRDGSVTSY